MPPAIDARVLVFALLVSCGTGVLFGFWPGMRWSRAARPNLLNQAGSGGRAANDGGVRMALGASPSRVLRTVMGGFVTAIAIGVALGLFGAWAASRVIA